MKVVGILIISYLHMELQWLGSWTWPCMTHWWITLDDHKVYVILWNILGQSFWWASVRLEVSSLTRPSRSVLPRRVPWRKDVGWWGNTSKSPAEKVTGNCDNCSLSVTYNIWCWDCFGKLLSWVIVSRCCGRWLGYDTFWSSAGFQRKTCMIMR